MNASKHKKNVYVSQISSLLMFSLLFFFFEVIYDLCSVVLSLSGLFDLWVCTYEMKMFRIIYSLMAPIYFFFVRLPLLVLVTFYASYEVFHTLKRSKLWNYKKISKQKVAVKLKFSASLSIFCVLSLKSRNHPKQLLDFFLVSTYKRRLSYSFRF